MEGSGSGRPVDRADPGDNFEGAGLPAKTAAAWRNAQPKVTGNYKRDAAAGTKLLKQYAEESRKDKGAVRVEVYIQISRVNHFSVVEVWENRQALDAHEAAAHTKKFRELIDPMLGSPYDERLHTLAE